MHCCCYVLTHEYPSDDVLNKILEPYNSEKVYDEHGDDPDFYTKYRPPITWDWWQVGGRYCGA